MRSENMKRITTTLLALTAALISSGAKDASNSGAKILERSMAAYTKLQSYADSGTVVVQSGNVYSHSTFKTFYERKGNSFFLEYRYVKDVGPSGELPIGTHYVFWMTKGTLEKWSFPGKLHEVFPPGSRSQIAPIAAADPATKGTSTLIPSLIFKGSGLFGVLQEIVQISEAGTEAVNGRKCHKLVGFAQSTYPSGKTFNRRPVTVWIDAENMLIRKLFVDTPKGYPMGSTLRITHIFNPQANPRIDARRFHFKVPTE